MKSKERLFQKRDIGTLLYIPAALIYLEVVLMILTKNEFRPVSFIAMIFVSLAGGTFFYLLSTLTKSETLNGWIAFILLEITTFIFMVSHFVQDTYQNYINIATMAGGAGGILKEFGDSIISLITHNYLKILLFEAPAILFIFLCLIFKVLKYRKKKGKAYGLLILYIVIFEVVGFGLSIISKNNRDKLTAEYDFNTVVRCFNLQTGLKTDLIYLIFHNPKACVFLPEESAEPVPSSYGYNVMDIDFDALIKEETDPEVIRMHEYVKSLTPTPKNEYTGLFKGKNLIYITVESMSEEMLTEEMMPTLYHMYESGIVFEDFYQPYWNGSTSTGEFANLLGLIPTKAMYSYEKTADTNLYFTIGNVLMRDGYFSRAYHNGTVEYYDRNLIHPNFGYEKFIADGNGMEDGLSGNWPISDLEMMQYALPQFVDNAPFSLYFMSITGHFPYYHDISVMVDKYGDRTAGRGYSDIMEAYICSEIDFDEAIKYLLEELKKVGEYEDTVFVLAPDHYPYGLTKSDAWATDKDYLPELYGYEPETIMERDHNALIIWSPVLEEMDPIVVSEPSYSVDILPTLLNLFGAEFDSRLLAGRDVLADLNDPGSFTKASGDLDFSFSVSLDGDAQMPGSYGASDSVVQDDSSSGISAETTAEGSGLVIWPDYSWHTSKGDYFALTDTFVSADGSPVDKEYVEKMKAIVRNKMTFSTNVLEKDYYNILFGN